MSPLRKILLTSAFVCIGAVAPAFADGVEISAPWTRATVRGASVGVGFMTIDNKGAEADTLTGAACDCAERVEIHETREENGVMTMRAVPKGVDIKPGKTVTFKPGTYHLMMIGLKTHFVPGETVHLTLHFARAGDVGADLQVEAFGADKPPAAEQTPAAKPGAKDAGKKNPTKPEPEADAPTTPSY